MNSSSALKLDRLFWLVLVGLCVFAGRSIGKPFVFEGFIETAPTNFPAPMTHVMRFEPNGKIDLALVESGRRLTSRPLERVTILGKLASDRVTNGVPIIHVEEVKAANWSSVQSDFSAGNVANWDGIGSSLYPSITREPLPEAGFLTASPNPVFYLIPLVSVDETFQFRLVGPNGWQSVVEASTDLVSWAPILTNNIVEGEINFTDRTAIKFPRRFYRARMTPRE